MDVGVSRRQHWGRNTGTAGYSAGLREIHGIFTTLFRDAEAVIKSFSKGKGPVCPWLQRNEQLYLVVAFRIRFAFHHYLPQ